jgi:hypothetical protein
MLVATATIGVFFGVGFFLLAGFAEGMIPSSGATLFWCSVTLVQQTFPARERSRAGSDRS